MTRWIKMGVILPLLALALAACGERVNVPPAYVGVVLSPAGYEAEIHPPSSFRLPTCMMPTSICSKLVLIEASDRSFAESMKLFMPQDELNLDFDIRGTASISPDPETVLRILDRMTTERSDKGTLYISFARVFETYALPKLRTAARTKMSQYTIANVVEQREAIGGELMADLQSALSGTPITVTFADLANVQYPPFIVAAKEIAKEREVAIQQEEAERARALVAAQTQLELAQASRLRRMEVARTVKEENDIVAKSVTPEYLAYRKIEVMEAAAKAGNTIFFPVEMLGSAALERAMTTHADSY